MLTNDRIYEFVNSQIPLKKSLQIGRNSQILIPCPNSSSLSPLCPSPFAHTSLPILDQPGDQPFVSFQEWYHLVNERVYLKKWSKME